MAGCTFPSYPLLDGDNGSSTPGAFFFGRKQISETQSAVEHDPPESQTNRRTSNTFSEATTFAEHDWHEGDAAGNAGYTRPKTPPQGSRGSPWSSYRNLHRNHPVFGFSKEAREKMYSEGVGKGSYEIRVEHTDRVC